MDKRLARIKEIVSDDWTTSISPGYLYSEHFDGLVNKSPLMTEMALSEESEAIKGEPISQGEVDTLSKAIDTNDENKSFEFWM